MSLHYALHMLERYRSGGLSWPGRLLCRLHLVGCRRCRERLQNLVDNDRFLKDLLAAGKNTPALTDQETDKATRGQFSGKIIPGDR